MLSKNVYFLRCCTYLWFCRTRKFFEAISRLAQFAFLWFRWAKWPIQKLFYKRVRRAKMFVFWDFAGIYDFIGFRQFSDVKHWPRQVWFFLVSLEWMVPSETILLTSVSCKNVYCYWNEALIYDFVWLSIIFGGEIQTKLSFYAFSMINGSFSD